MRAGLYLGGAVFWMLALWLIYSAFQLPGAVQSADGEVANLQLMHLQTTDLIMGVGAAITASVLTGCGAIIEALRSPPHE